MEHRMRNLRNTVIRLAVATSLAFALSSCGLGVGYGFLLGDELIDDVDVDIILYDGLWRGDYVYYLGDWYYLGRGTPYMHLY
jgi:hypothetical protein